MLHHFELDQLRVVAAGGPDRIAFLQGQLTQDLARIKDSGTCLAGLADAKGRLLWAGHMFSRGELVCLLAPEEAADALASRLKLFVLRAKVEIAVAGFAIIGLADASGDVALTDLPGAWQALHLAADPARRVLVADPGVQPALPGLSKPADDWRLHDIRTGIPEVVPQTSGQFVPQMVNLDLLDGISFSKGCYTGQEIVARTRYLGRLKRRMLRFSAPAPPPAAGTPVAGLRGDVGQVVSSAATATGSELLAVVRLDEIGGPLFLDAGRQQPLTRLSLPYAVPEADLPRG